MISNINPQYYQSFADELKAKFRRINDLTRKNSGAIGNYHEGLITAFLKEFLPQRFSVRTGFIYFDEERISRQTDILIIDEYEPINYISRQGDFVIAHPNQVSIAFEVKTNLTHSNKKGEGELEKAIVNISETKKLYDDVTHPKPCGMVFAFDGSNLVQKSVHKIIKDNKISSDNFPDMIYNFTKKIFYLKSVNALDLITFSDKHEANLLAFFLANIMGNCEEFNRQHNGNIISAHAYDILKPFEGKYIKKQEIILTETGVL